MAENVIRVDEPDGAPEPVVRILAASRRTIAVHVTGDLDTLGTPLLQAALDCVWSGDVRRLCVDLTDVDFVGVPALHALLRANETARRRGVPLDIDARAGFAARVMRHLGLGEVLRNSRPSRLRSVPASAPAPSIPVARRPVHDSAPLTDDPAVLSTTGRRGDPG